jgi:diacylglycerol kinase (ATP)
MTMQKKWGFIINPVAGNGYARKYSNKVSQMARKYDLDASIVHTERRMHAAEIAAQMADSGFTHIIAVGGDGVINEAATGILDKDNITFGVVSAGTGNDFAPVLGFSDHFTDEDWHELFKENTIKMDIGKCNEHYFLNGMGLGFDAQVATENYKEDAELKSGSGTKYFWHIIKNILFYKERYFRSETNGYAREAVTFMKTIGNGRRFGGGYKLTPKAIANDGLLDVCLVEPLSVFERFRLFLKVPHGTHLGNKKVNYFQTEKLHITFNEKVPHHLDGELYFAQVFDVSILPQKLNILYNASGNHCFHV